MECTVTELSAAWSAYTDARSNANAAETRLQSAAIEVAGTQDALALATDDLVHAVERASDARKPTEGYCTYISDQDAYYLRSILARLRACAAEIQDGPTLGGEVLADNIDWLDCFIEKHSQVAA
jgi:hypothetical protein